MSQMIESFMQPQAGGVPGGARVLELEEAGGAGALGAAPLLREPHPLHGLPVRLQVCVGEAQMSVGDLLGARENEVLVLQNTVDQPVDLMLQGRVVARGQLVAVDGMFAVRICELPLSLKL